MEKEIEIFRNFKKPEKTLVGEKNIQRRFQENGLARLVIKGGWYAHRLQVPKSKTGKSESTVCLREM